MKYRGMVEDIRRERVPNVPLVGAEIGVERGEHANAIVLGLPLKELWLIDLWGPYILIQGKPKIVNKSRDYERVCGMAAGNGCVRVLKKSSLEAALEFPKAYFDFVYIDANHNYEHVITDIRMWFAKVKRGGYLGGHDYGAWEGVTRAVDEWTGQNRYVLNVKGSDWWIRR